MTGPSHTEHLVDSNDADLERAAEAWLVRLTSGTATDADFQSAREWCRRSDAHRQAFQQARRFWRDTGKRRPKRSAVRTRLTTWRSIAAAASLLLIVGLGTVAIRDNWGAQYRTGPAEQRQVVLSDGSIVTLDAGTALDIDFSGRERRIHLRSGQALFKVAHDASRPFEVRDVDVTATALGTVYAVRHEATGPRVTVREGVVRVSAPGTASITLEARQQAAWSSPALQSRSVDPDDALAWERGLLIFRLTPLAEVVEEMNRHRHGVIVIASSRLRELRISGVFRLDQQDNLDGGIETLESVFGIQATRLGGYFVLLH